MFKVSDSVGGRPVQRLATKVDHKGTEEKRGSRRPTE